MNTAVFHEVMSCSMAPVCHATRRHFPQNGIIHRCSYKQLKFLYVLGGWLTVHRSITLIDLQLDAQNSYLFIYNTFIKILYMFRALPCSSSGGLRRNCIHAASGIVTL